MIRRGGSSNVHGHVLVLCEDGVVGVEGVLLEVGGALRRADGDVELRGVSGRGEGGGGRGGRTRGLPMQTMRGAILYVRMWNANTERVYFAISPFVPQSRDSRRDLSICR